MGVCITIGREYGSGGHEVGEKLANKLNIPFYDNILIDRVSKDSGLCKEIIKKHDEKPTSSFLYNLVTDPYSVSFNRSSSITDVPFGQKIFLAQFDTVKKIADEGSCVIVGRCADYILKDRDDLLSIFITANKEFKMSRLSKEFPDLSAAKLSDLIDKKERSRASYYNYNTSNKWGNASNYNLSLDSSKIGIDGCVKIIEDYISIYSQKSTLTQS